MTYPHQVRTNPADGGRTSYLLLHWATEIAKSIHESGAYDPSDVLSIAFATANTNLERLKLRSRGTNKLTAAGRARERELLTRMSPEEIENEYEALTEALEEG
jgi:hypothetical protein